MPFGRRRQRCDTVYLGVGNSTPMTRRSQLRRSRAGRRLHTREGRVYLTLNVLKTGELRDALLHLARMRRLRDRAVLVQDLARFASSSSLSRSRDPRLDAAHRARHVRAPACCSRWASPAWCSRARTRSRISAVHPRCGPRTGTRDLCPRCAMHRLSGQCFMSGMISNAAPIGEPGAVLPQRLLLTDASTKAELDRGFLISAKDLGAWEHLAAIAEAGVGVSRSRAGRRTRICRHGDTRLSQLPGYVARGTWNPSPPPELTEPLVQIFSRGLPAGVRWAHGRGRWTRTIPTTGRGTWVGGSAGGSELLVSLTTRSPGDGLGFEHPDGAARGPQYRASLSHAVRTLARGGRGRDPGDRDAGKRARGWWSCGPPENLLEQAQASFAAVLPPRDNSRIQLHVRVFGSVVPHSGLSGAETARR